MRRRFKDIFFLQQGKGSQAKQFERDFMRVVCMHAGIRVGGRIDLNIIRNGNLTAQRYANEILRSHVIPYAATIGDSFLLMQNKAHTVRLMKSFLEAETI
ncbi:hypothetical protein TNCV_1674251 [Trichonephila clavipes]|nr:hypothetical protein TNCV_1674251 [Trichonephila clavipes]